MAQFWAECAAPERTHFWALNLYGVNRKRDASENLGREPCRVKNRHAVLSKISRSISGLIAKGGLARARGLTPHHSVRDGRRETIHGASVYGNSAGHGGGL